MNAESPIVVEEPPTEATVKGRPSLRRSLLVFGPIVILLGALALYLLGGRSEATENASLQTGLVPISANIAGQVASVEVTENEMVRRGQILFRLDTDDYVAVVADAEAQLAAARTDVGATQADYQEALSLVRASRARAAYAQREVARQRALLAEGISSRQQYDEAALQANTARDAIAENQAKADSFRARLSGNASGPIETQPAVRRAAAQLERGRILLNNATVRAPQDGIVTRVNQLQVGTYVMPGRALFMLAGTRYWVQANFKEDQLRYMRVGQPARVTIDAFPDNPLKGHVASFSPGTGSSFSVLPAENATGNWVKVMQRVPVQIEIDELPAGLPLHAGLSVEVEIDTGHRRHLFGPDTQPNSPQVATQPRSTPQAPAR